jgi:hypothetical protein
MATFSSESTKHPSGVKGSALAGAYDFPVDPDLAADKAPFVWFPHLDPTTVVVAPAPAAFADAQAVQDLTPTFEHHATDGMYWVIGSVSSRLAVVFTADATTTTSAAAVVPFEADFVERADAAVRLWQALNGKPPRAPREALTQQRRERLTLMLRALDAHLGSQPYRAIALGLFGSERIPAGPAWKTHELRGRTIRMVRTGVILMQGGYLHLLHGSLPRST